jgi:hypothetical protein
VKQIRCAALLLCVITMMCMSVSSPSASAQETSGPTAWPEWTCDTFPDGRDAAIIYFENFGGPATLDPDNDGIACNEDEDDSTTSNGPSAWPEWTCDTFPDGRDAAIEYFDAFGGPVTLDPDGDGIPCNEDDNAAEDTVTPEDSSSDTVPESPDPASAATPNLVSLPRTGAGSGQQSPSEAMIPLLVAAIGLLVIAATRPAKRT